MTFQSWLTSLKSLVGGKDPKKGRRTDHRKRAARVRLRLEQLEDRLAPSINTTTALGASVSGISVASATYGTPVTLAATVAPASGTAAPTAGSVDFTDGATDLGSIATETVSGSNAVFTLTTTPKQLQVIQASGGVHTITATYSAGTGFNGSSGSLVGGLKVNPAPLTITATTNAKTYDSTAAAASLPTVSGLISGDTVTGLSESYAYTFTPVDMSSQANFSWAAIDTYPGDPSGVWLPGAPTGNVTLGGVPFNIKSNASGNQAWAAGVAANYGTGQESITINVGVFGVTNVYTLINTWWSSVGPTSYVALNFTGSAGATYTKNLIGGTDTRDYNQDSYPGTINGTTTVNVFSVAADVVGSPGRLDMQKIALPAAFATQTLTSVTLLDTGGPQLSRAILDGVTVNTGSSNGGNLNVGTSKTLSVKSYSVNDGNGGADYAVTTVANTTGLITPAPLTITAATNTKTYDGTTSAAALPTVAGLIGGDGATGLTDVYSDANIGTSKTLSVSAYTLADGNGGNNYTVTTVPAATGTINAPPPFFTVPYDSTMYLSCLGGSTAASAVTEFGIGTTMANAVPYLTGLPYNSNPSGEALVGNFAAGASVNFYIKTVGGGKTYWAFSILDTSDQPSIIDFTDPDHDFSASGSIVAQTSANTWVLHLDDGGSYLVDDDDNDVLVQIRLQPDVNTTTTVTANAATAVYGTPVTLKATVSGASGSAAPTAGSVDFQDGTTDLGSIATETVSGSNALFTLTTTPRQLQVIQANGGVHTITAVYSPGSGFNGSSGSLVGGLKVNPAPLTITATTNTKTYDSTTAAAAIPTVSGLIGNDALTGLSESYTDASAGTGKTLVVNTAPTSVVFSASSSPNALAFDAAGNRYVANANGTVTEFAPGATTPTATLTGLNDPVSLAFDAAGNLYVANQGNYTVSKFAPGALTPSATLTPTAPSIGPSVLDGLAVDAAGDVYVANYSPFGLVSEFAPGTLTPSATITGLSYPAALAVDAGGNLYVASEGAGTVTKYAPGATSPFATISGLNQPDALAFSPAGNLYVANYSGGTVGIFVGSATTSSATLNGLNNPISLAFDAAGNLYAANSGNGTVSKFAPGAITPSATLTGLSAPQALAVDAAGDLFVADTGLNAVVEFKVPYVINDGHGGANYAVTTVPNTTGVITSLNVGTTTTVNSSAPTLIYGTPVTFTATVAASSGTAAPTAGSVDFQDGSTDLGSIATETVAGSNAIFTLTTTPRQLQVIQANGGVHTIMATYSPGNGFTGSGGTLAGGLKVNPAPLTITATTNTKTYDSTTTAAAVPTVTGLIGGDTVTGLGEVYGPVASAGGFVEYGNENVLNTGSYSSDPKAGATLVGLAPNVTSDATLTVNFHSSPFTPSAGDYPGTDQIYVGSVQTGTHDGYSVDSPRINGPQVITMNYASLVPAGQTISALTLGIAADDFQFPVWGQPFTAKINGSVDTALTNKLETFDETGPKVHFFTIGIDPSTLLSNNILTLNIDEGGDGGDGWAIDFLTIGVNTSANGPGNPNVGTGKALSVSSYTVSDGNGGANYAVTTVANMTGVITPAPLTITATTNTKTYDSTTTAAALPSVTGLQGADSVTALSEVYALPAVTQGGFVEYGNENLLNTGSYPSDPKAGATLVGLAPNVTTDATLSVGHGNPFSPSAGDYPGTDQIYVGSIQTASHDGYAAAPQRKNGPQVITMDYSSLIPAGQPIKSLTLGIAADDFQFPVWGQPFTAKINGTVDAALTSKLNSLAETGATVHFFTIGIDPSLLQASNVLTLSIDEGGDGGDGWAVDFLTVGVNTIAGAGNNLNVGTGKTLSVSSYTLHDGNGGANYAVTTVVNTTGAITPAPLTISAVKNTKTYDSTTIAAAVPTVVGLQGNDSVTGLAEVYADKNAGPSKTVSVSTYTVGDGNSGNNYRVTAVTNTTGVINKAPLTITALSNAKFFDNTTTAAAIPTVSGLIGNDGASGLVEVYSNPALGANKTLSVSAYSISDGNSGNNYAVTTAINTTGIIDIPPALSTSTTIASSAGSIVYGNTVTYTIVVTASTGASSAPGAGATVDISDNSAGYDLGLAVFVSSTGLSSTYTLTTTVKTFNVTIPLAHTITATFIGSGTLPSSHNTVGQIVTPAPLTITATVNSKTYDSTTSATAAPVVTGLVTGDTVTGLAEKYSDKNAGSSKTLSVSAYMINDGNGGNNYAVTTVANTSGVINKAPLTITATTSAKTYDSTTTAAAVPTVAGLIGNDSATGLAEVYGDKNAGSNKTLSISAYTISDGNGGNNYAVSTVANTTGVITAAPLTIAAVTNTKNYDGTTSAAALPTAAGLQGADHVTGLAEVYSDPNVGTGKTLSVSAGYAVNDGYGGNNYIVTALVNTTGVILPALTNIGTTTTVGSSQPAATYGTPVTFTARVTPASGNAAPSGSVEFYDGTNDLGPGIAESPSGTNSLWALTTTMKQLPVGAGQAISAKFTGSGSFQNSTGSLAGGESVTPRRLVIAATANTKSWDGTASATAIPTFTGLVSGDSVSGLAEAYTDTNVGTGKTLTVNPGYVVSDGNGGKNYIVATASANTGAITPPNSILTLPNSVTVIEPPQGLTQTIYLTLTVNLPLNYTVSYQTIGGTALAGSDFVAVNPGTVHVVNTQTSVQIPITIRGGAYQQPGGPATKSFAVQLVSAVNNGSGNAFSQALLNAPNSMTTVILQQVKAPTIRIANQASASAGVFVNITTNWPTNPAFTAAQYAQAGGDVYLNDSTSVGGAFFSSATIHIPSADLVASGAFQIPNFRIPAKPPAGLLTVTLVAISANAALDPAANMALVGFP